MAQQAEEEEDEARRRAEDDEEGFSGLHRAAAAAAALAEQEERDREETERARVRRLQEQAQEAAKREAEDEAELEADREAWQMEEAWLRKTAEPLPWHRRLLGPFWSGERGDICESRRFVVACDLGDPISCVHLGPDGSCMAGSVQGRVWLLPGASRASASRSGASAKSSGGKVPWQGPPPPPRGVMVAGFSDEGVRGLFVDEESAYASYFEGSTGWRCRRPYMQSSSMCFRSLDRKNTQSVKYLLQRGPKACVMFPLATIIVDVVKREHHQHSFKLFDYGASSDVAATDFDGEQLIIITRTRAQFGPCFFLIHLERNERHELDDLPEASRISSVKLWGPDCVVCSVGRVLHVYDHIKRQLRFSLQGHNAEILAVDASNENAIASLSADGNVKVWCGSTGVCLRSVGVVGANFFLAYPYCLCMQDQRILVSSDEGVWLLELGLQSDLV